MEASIKIYMEELHVSLGTEDENNLGLAFRIVEFTSRTLISCEFDYIEMRRLSVLFCEECLVGLRPGQVGKIPFSHLRDWPESYGNFDRCVYSEMATELCA